LPPGAMKDEIGRYIGQLVTYSLAGRSVTTYTGRYSEDRNLNGSLDGGEDVNGNGLVDVDIQSASFIPGGPRPEVPYSAYDSRLYLDEDITFDQGDDNATIGFFNRGGDDVIEGIMEEDYFAFYNPDNHPDVFFNGVSAFGAVDTNAACMSTNHLCIRASHDGTNERPLQHVTGCTDAQTTPIGMAELYWT